MSRKCNCAGPCGPQFPQYESQSTTDDGLTRRQLLTVIGAGAAGSLITLDSPASAKAKREATARAFEEWKADVHKPAQPIRYKSNTHVDARMPLGGIGTGNFDLGVDGQITTWQLFNTLRDGHVPLFFGVKCGKTTKMLQTKGGPNGIPKVSSIEMTGEYPLATLKYQDSDLPVHLEMTAFSSFEPLNTPLSSMPIAYFVFKIHNPTKKQQQVSLAAFMQNPVGYDAMGVPISFNSVGFNSVIERLTNRHPNFGGNVNRILGEEDAIALHMTAQPGSDFSLSSPLHVYTNLNPGAFRSPYDGLPSTLALDALDKISLNPQPSTLNRVIWLEDAPIDLHPDRLRAALEAVKGGARLIFSGREQPLLKLYADVTQGKPLDRGSLKPDILFEDFENGYDSWKVEGTAFGTKPATGTLAGQQAVSGFIGKGLVNSFLGGDDPMGKLTSKTFTIERNFIRFLVGGGRQPTTQIRLLIDGKTVRAAAGREVERLEPAHWDVREFRGKSAHIEIVDEQTGGWGHINVDHIEFADLPGNPESLELLDELLPARFTGIRQVDANTTALIAPQPHADSRERDIANSYKVLSRRIGSGTVDLAFRPLLPPDQLELVGARRNAVQNLFLLSGVQFQASQGVPARAPGFGSLALAAIGGARYGTACAPEWSEVWQDFTTHDTSMGRGMEFGPTPPGETTNGAVASTVTLAPGKTMEIPFILAWHYPNYYNRDGVNMGNHYATRWPDAAAVMKEAIRDFKSIREKTERFRTVFYDSTLPYWMLDAVSSQISTLRHAGIVFRPAKGDVYGWEGSNGCCDPTCTHVWGYEQTLARLFPDLERSMRLIDFKHQQRPDGGVNNRTAFPSPPRPTGENPFTDGHASCILKAYREALNHPDDAWMKEYWPHIKKAVEYLINRDAATSGGNPNGLLEDDQWNTYDEALHGVTTFIGSYYLAALRAGEEWAKRMGDDAFAKRCQSVFQDGQKNLIARCWNGEYFHQDLPDYKQRNGEVGPGCMSDQLIGQWWAHQLGLGYVIPPDYVKKALTAVYKYNFKDLTGWNHIPRAFAGDGDKGLIICTWPKGGRPNNVMLYSDEVWTGIEYQVAGHMLYEGMLDEGFAIVKGLRERYDGRARKPIPRNPWNEIECGGHYARAMASWSLLLALSGYEYDGILGHLRFTPRNWQDNFKSFFSGPEGWGSLKQTRKGSSQTNQITVTEGKFAITKMHLRPKGTPQNVRVTLAGKAVKAVVKADDKGVFVTLDSQVTVDKGQTLSVTLSA